MSMHTHTHTMHAAVWLLFFVCGGLIILLTPHLLLSCILANQSEAGLAALGECPYDPGGYFVCKGVEKVPTHTLRCGFVVTAPLVQ